MDSGCKTVRWLALICCCCCLVVPSKEQTFSDLKKWLSNFEDQSMIELRKLEHARLQYYKDMTSSLSNNLVNAEIAAYSFYRTGADQAQAYLEHFKGSLDKAYRRHLEMIALTPLNFGYNIFNNKKKFYTLINDMQASYASSYACTENQYRCTKQVPLYPDLQIALANAETADELFQLWYSWHQQLAENNNQRYLKFVDIAKSNAAYSTFQEYWEKLFEGNSRELNDELQKLERQVRPLYIQLHTYVRRKLNVTDTGLSSIQPHLLRHQDTSDWSTLLPRLLPYSTVETTDIGSKLNETSRIYKLADQIFQKLGFDPIPEVVWPNSVFHKYHTGDQSCFPHVCNLFDDGASAIIDCEPPSQRQLFRAFRQMAKVQYHNLCIDHRVNLCRRAHLGLTEAVGGAVELLTMNPKFLKANGFYKGNADGRKENINHLMRVALQTVPRIAYHLALYTFQKNIYSTPMKKFNFSISWDSAQFRYQGLAPIQIDHSVGPVHIDLYANQAAFEPVLGTVLSFQLFKAACKKRNVSSLLHKCSVDEMNPNIAVWMKDLMQEGLSLPLKDMLKYKISDTEIDADPMMEYFKPLMEWLERENERQNECYGWSDHYFDWKHESKCNISLPGDSSVPLKGVLRQYETAITGCKRQSASAWWTYETDPTEANRQTLKKVLINESTVQNDYSVKCRPFYLGTVKNAKAKRALIKLRRRQLTIGDEQLSSLLDLQLTLLPNAKRNLPCDQCLFGNSELPTVMRESSNLTRLTAAWLQWHDQRGQPFKSHTSQFLNISNNVAHSNGYDNIVDMFHEEIQAEEMTDDEAEQLWLKILPLYERLHGYVRSKMKRRYTGQFNTSTLPAHILGSPQGITWSAVANFVTKADQNNCTDTWLDVVDRAEDFYVSLGLPQMTKTFRDNLVVVSNDADCTPTVRDMYSEGDFRACICNSTRPDDVLAIYAAIGRIQYHMHLANQTTLYRTAPSDAFYAALDGVVQLTVSSHGYNFTNASDDIAFLLTQAMEVIPRVSFEYVSGLWRRAAMTGSVAEEDWNGLWWLLRSTHQGIQAPVPRSSASFDPAAELPYTPVTVAKHQFQGAFMRFQIFQGLCALAGHRGPLHRCDLYDNKEVGRKLADSFALGSTVSWRQLLRTLANESQITGTAMLQYFQPLMEYLKIQNATCHGWGVQWPESMPQGDMPTPRCGQTMDWLPEDSDDDDDDDNKQDIELDDFLKHYNVVVTAVNQKLATAIWNYNKQGTLDNGGMLLEALVEKFQTEAEQRKAALQLSTDRVSDPAKRILLNTITAPTMQLDRDEVTQFVSLFETMMTIYNGSWICPIENRHCNRENSTDDQRWSLSHLMEIMAHSGQPDLLQYVWMQWRREISDEEFIDIETGFEVLLEVGNAVARKSGFQDVVDMWRHLFKYNDMPDALQLWQQLLPVYEKLHANLRWSLIQTYGNITDDLHLAAHLLGDMWAKQWSTSQISPFPANPHQMASQEMTKQEYTIDKVVKQANDFFDQLGLPIFEDLDSFRQKSIFATVDDLTCEPLAQEFYNGKDYFIKTCAQPDMAGLLQVYNLMTKVRLMELNKDQPVAWKLSSSPILRDAIAGAVQLSVGGLEHLRKMGLLNQPNSSKKRLNYIGGDISEFELSYLHWMARQVLPSLSYGYVVDMHRQGIVESQATGKSRPNQTWWQLRTQYQGIIQPPFDTTTDDVREDDFPLEPNIFLFKPYMVEFYGTIMKFSIYKGLCKAAGHHGPLHRCDLSASPVVGKLLIQAVGSEAGQSWTSAYELLTNTTDISTRAMLDYFEPLVEWLDENNDDCYGWGIVWPDDLNLPLPRCGNSATRGLLSVTLAFLSWVVCWIYYGQIV